MQERYISLAKQVIDLKRINVEPQDLINEILETTSSVLSLHTNQLSVSSHPERKDRPEG